MASLTKIGRFYYVQYYDHAGKKKKVKGYSDKVATQQLANRIENEKTAIKRGDVDPIQQIEKERRALPLEDHIRAYETHLTAKGNTDNHVSYVIKDIRRCVEFTGIASAVHLERSMIDQWVIALEKPKAKGKPGDAPKTINRRVASVQQFLRWMHDRGAVTKYVLAGYPRRQTKGHERRIYRHLLADEAQTLIAKAPDPERRDIYRFALLTGFRRAEIASMTPASFNFAKRTVTVRANDAKNKNRHQTIPLHQGLVESLRSRCNGKADDQPIFAVPSKLEAASLLRADCKAIGIDPKNVSFHGLRHTFITRMAEQNVHPKILQDLARHSTLETTLRYYTHFRQDDEHAAINALQG